MARTTAKTQQETRQRLLETAAAQFAEQGLAGANINQISTAAGLAKGTVYNYFPSKERLFLAVVEQAFARTVEIDLELGETVRQRLLALAAEDLAWVKQHEGFARVFVRECFAADPRFYPQVIEAALPFIQLVEQVLDAGVRSGQVRDDRPVRGLALLFTGMLDLALIQHWGSGGAWPSLEEIPELIVTQFLEGSTASGNREHQHG